MGNSPDIEHIEVQWDDTGEVIHCLKANLELVPAVSESGHRIRAAIDSLTVRIFWCNHSRPARPDEQPRSGDLQIVADRAGSPC
jgi:hypothetical protein